MEKYKELECKLVRGYILFHICIIMDNKYILLNIYYLFLHELNYARNI